MAGAPADFVLRCGLDTLYAIHTAAFQTAMPAIAAPAFTICFWVKAQPSQEPQVIVNCGQRRADEPGWSCFLHDGQIVVTVGSHADERATIACSYPDDGRWHHVTATFDSTRAAVTATLDGSQAGWRDSALCLQPAAPVGGHAGLIVGGYTDAAGGHFNYTFGHNGSGHVDDLRIYPRALSAAEIAAFAPAPAPAPVARFTWEAPRGDAPMCIQFDASASTAGATCLWTWADGQRSVGRVVARDFAYAGAHPVRLDVIDDNHQQAMIEEVILLNGAENPLRLTPVFVNGADGYAAFRIPSIVRALNGDLVAFAEGRVESASDATRTIRIVSKISSDNGRTWSNLRVVSRNVVDGVEYAAMNASPVVDTVRGTGRIVLVFKQLECSEWEIAEGRGVMRTACILSDDHGQSWHGERDITAQVHRPGPPDDWRIQTPTLGHAIQLCRATACPATRGRIFHVGSRTRAGDSVFAGMNYAFWSDDLGESWQIGDFITTRWDGSPAHGLNEATAVELADGRVLVNSRNYQDEQPVHLRAVTVGTFDECGRIVFGLACHDATLIEPAVQASMLRYTWPDDPGASGRSRILFANPAHTHARTNMTVRLSYDEGITWPAAKVIDPGPAAYSDLVVQTDGGIGLLYERGNTGGIVYASFTLAWLSDGQDTLQAVQHAIDGAHLPTTRVEATTYERNT